MKILLNRVSKISPPGECMFTSSCPAKRRSYVRYSTVEPQTYVRTAFSSYYGYDVKGKKSRKAIIGNR